MLTGGVAAKGRRGGGMLKRVIHSDCQTEPKKRAWRHGRAWKMKIRAWKNQDPCFNFYKHICALLHKYPV